MTRAEEIDANLAEIIEQSGQHFTMDGADYPAVITRDAASSEAMEGGLWSVHGGFLVTRRALLAKLPNEGKKILIDGQQFTILKVYATASLPPVRIDYGSTQAPR